MKLHEWQAMMQRKRGPYSAVVISKEELSRAQELTARDVTRLFELASTFCLKSNGTIGRSRKVRRAIQFYGRTA